MNMLLIVTVFSSTSSGNHSSSSELSHGTTSSGTSTGQHSLSVEMSYWGTVSGKCLSKRPRHTQNKLGRFTERHTFARDTQTLLRSVPKGPLAAKCRTAHASTPNNQITKTLRHLCASCHCNKSWSAVVHQHYTADPGVDYVRRDVGRR